MTKQWRIHEETLGDRPDGSVYEEQRAGLGLGFLGELRGTLAELRAAPGTGVPDRAAPAEALVRRRRVHRFPYAVVFAESTTEYVVIAVMHLRRQPGYWLARLEGGG